MLPDFLDDQVHLIGQSHPLFLPDPASMRPPGETIAEIVDSLEWDHDKWGPPVVSLRRGDHAWEVHRSLWHAVRPSPGTKVYLAVKVQGPAIGLVASALIPYAASSFAGFLGFATGSLQYSLVVAGVSIVAGLALNALIPPPQQPEAESRERSDVFFITGSRNTPRPYDAWPNVYGRHKMFFDPMATGYSETIDATTTYFRARMTMGYGPVALEDLRIGTTSILNFDNVQVEFRNVDQTETESLIPGLASSGIVTAWRSGADWMRLYPQDITTDNYSDRLDAGADDVTQGTPVTRTTRADTHQASVDITFTNGLAKVRDDDGKLRPLQITVKIEYRENGSTGAWTPAPDDGLSAAGEISYTGETRDPQRFTRLIDFPSTSTWDIRATVTFVGTTGGGYIDLLRDTYLTAIRSISPADTVGDADVAEIAIRVKATEQLNGQIDTLNAIVHKMVPTRSGGSWTAPQRTRHPAWAYLDMLQGPHLPADARIPDSEIDLPAFEDWASEDPHWTFDYVVRGEQRVADVLDLCAASGRARRALADFKHTIIRDEDGPVRHVFGPRNSWGLRGQITFPDDIHAFRLLVRSEDADWRDDEVMVYNDGYDAASATKIETLRLPGTVIASTDSDEGNAWRLGRYFLAAQLRRETFEWNADWESFLLTRGDRVQMVHDVAVVGVGQARVTGKSGSVLTLDEDFGVTGAHSLQVVESDGTITALTATGSGQDWTVTVGDASGVAEGDKVAVYETTDELLDLRITGIFPDTDGSARITAVEDAPAVRTADSGTIPAYSPTVSGLEPDGPPQPVVTEARSDETTALWLPDGRVLPRVLVLFAPRVSQTVSGVRELRWRRTGSNDAWTIAQYPIAQAWSHTSALEEGQDYDVQAQAVGIDGRSRGWADVNGGSPVTATIGGLLSDVTSLVVTPNARTVSLVWAWVEDPEQNLRGFEIRHSANPADGWDDADKVARVSGTSRDWVLPARAGIYLIKAYDWEGNFSATAVSDTVTEAEIALNASDLSNTLYTTKLNTTAQAFAYDGSGNLITTGGAPADGTFTASIVGFSTPYYEFTVVDESGTETSVQNTTSNSYTYTPPATITGPSKEILRVDVREGAATGPIIATDQMAIPLLREGTGVAAVVIALSNRVHDAQAEPDGSNPNLTGSGGNIYVYEGADTLTYDGVGTANGTWKVDSVVVVSGTASVDTTPSDGGTFAVFGDALSLTSENAVVRYTVIGKTAAGESFTRVEDATLTKVRNGPKGDKGDKGDAGDAGDDGATIVSGIVYYDDLQSSAPSSPDDGSVTFNSGTGQLSGMRSGWQQTPPRFSMTDTNLRGWTSVFTARVPNGQTTTTDVDFGTVESWIVFTDDIKSDNYVAGSSGWEIERDTGNAEFNDVTVRGDFDMNGGDIRVIDGARRFVADPEGIGDVVDIRNSTSLARNALSITQEGNDAAVFIENTGTQQALEIDNDRLGNSADAIYVRSRGSSGSTCADLRNTNGTGGHAQIALSTANGAYAFFAPSTSGDGYLDSSGGGYNPFTGVHMAMLAKGEEVEPGDILIDAQIVVRSISDAFSEVARSSAVNQAGAIGVLQRRKDVWITPPAFVDRDATRTAHLDAEEAERQAAQARVAPARAAAREAARNAVRARQALRNAPREEQAARAAEFRLAYRAATTAADDADKAGIPKKIRGAQEVMIADPTVYHETHDLVAVNALGEGAMNVCGRGGDIAVGDLIVCSDMPGKGQKQADDIVRSYTVAKAREAVTFASPDDTAQIACIYLCG